MNPIADLTLIDYLHIIRKRKEIIILCFLLVTVTVLLYTRQLEKKKKPIYQATATVRVQQTQSTMNEALGKFVKFKTNDISTELEMVKSYGVMELVALKIGRIKEDQLKYDHEIDGKEYAGSKEELSEKIVREVNSVRNLVSVRQKELTNVIELTVRTQAKSNDEVDTKTAREEAKRIANFVAEAYKAENAYLKNKDLNAAKRDIKNLLDEYGKELNTLKEQEVELIEVNNFITTPDKEFDLLISQISSLESEQAKLQININQEKDRLEQLKEIKKEDLIKDDFSRLKVLFPEIYNHPSLSTARRNIENSEARLRALLEDAKEKHPRVIDLRNTISELQSKLNSDIKEIVDDTIISMEERIKNVLEKDLKEIEEKIKEYKERLEKIRDKLDEYKELQNEIRTNNQIYAMLIQRHEELNLSTVSGDVDIVERALMPRSPINMGGSKYAKLFAGGVVGLLLGLVLALLVESLDTSIGTIEDIENYLQTSVLGVIPNIEINKEPNLSISKTLSSLKLPAVLNPFRSRKWLVPPQGPPAHLIVQHDPRAPEAEAFRALRTNIILKDSKNNEPMALLVTSASPQEGKSAIASNLALAMAQLKKMTLLVDCDLRRPEIHKIFGLDKEPGLADIIMGNESSEEAIRSATDLLFGSLQDVFEQVPGVDFLHILTSGSYISSPSEILASKEVTELMEQLKEKYEVIILDSPPILPVTDSLILANKVDNTLLVYRAGKSNRRIPKRAMELIEENSENGSQKVLGVILNDIKPEIQSTVSTSYPYYYYYKSGEKEKT